MADSVMFMASRSGLRRGGFFEESRRYLEMMNGAVAGTAFSTSTLYQPGYGV